MVIAVLAVSAYLVFGWFIAREIIVMVEGEIEDYEARLAYILEMKRNPMYTLDQQWVLTQRIRELDKEYAGILETRKLYDFRTKEEVRKSFLLHFVFGWLPIFVKIAFQEKKTS